MANLEELKAGTTVNGLSSTGLSNVTQVELFGDQAVKVTSEDAAGTFQSSLVYRNEENTLEAVAE